MTRPAEPLDSLARRLPWAALALVLIAVAVIRIRLLDVPLERDEGEYGYMASLLLQGVPPWAEAWNMKLPGIYAVYALLLGVGGPSVSAIHAGLLLANLWNALACAWLARRLFGSAALAAVAGAAFAAASLSPEILGLWAHAEPFAVAFALGGLLLALERRGAAALAGAGVSFALAVLVKQNAFPLALFGAAWVAWLELRGGARPESLRRLAVFAAGALVPPVATALALHFAGVFPRFWFWTVTYAASYGAQLSVAEGLSRLAYILPKLVSEQAVWWLSAAIGLSATVWSPAVCARAPFLLGLFAAGCAAASLGLYFRAQYFVLLLPALALLAAAAAHALTPTAPRIRALACSALALAGLATPIGVQWQVLVRASPDEVSRAVYASNPFPEARALARAIAALTAPDARIAVIGSEPEIYFYSGRRAATGYLYTYPLMEPQPYAHQMHREMIGELVAAKPEMLVYVSVPMSWLARPESPTALLAWFEAVSATEYETIAVAEISGAETHWAFGEEARTYAPRSPYWLSLLRRKS